MYVKHYVDLETEEVSDSKPVATAWYRDGHSVEVYHDGKWVLTLNSMGV